MQSQNSQSCQQVNARGISLMLWVIATENRTNSIEVVYRRAVFADSELVIGFHTEALVGLLVKEIVCCPVDMTGSSVQFYVQAKDRLAYTVVIRRKTSAEERPRGQYKLIGFQTCIGEILGTDLLQVVVLKASSLDRVVGKQCATQLLEAATQQTLDACAGHRGRNCSHKA